MRKWKENIEESKRQYKELEERSYQEYYEIGNDINLIHWTSHLLESAGSTYLLDAARLTPEQMKKASRFCHIKLLEMTENPDQMYAVKKESVNKILFRLMFIRLVGASMENSNNLERMFRRYLEMFQKLSYFNKEDFMKNTRLIDFFFIVNKEEAQGYDKDLLNAFVSIDQKVEKLVKSTSAKYITRQLTEEEIIDLAKFCGKTLKEFQSSPDRKTDYERVMKELR